MVRRSSGQSSDTSADPMDHSPPMPIPAKNRKTAKVQMPVAKAARSVKTENERMLNIMVRTRPKRSAMGPQIMPVPQPTMKRAKSRPP